MIATLIDAKTHLEIVGIPGLTKFLKQKITGKSELLEVTDPHIQYPFFLRIPSSDTFTYWSIIQHQDYQFKTHNSPQVIVDAGANIGLAAVYFANQYPTAKIIAIEPETENFRLLQKNVAPYPNIVPLQAALWDKEGKVNLGVGCGSQDGFMTEEILTNTNSPESKPESKNNDILGEVDALTMDAILARYQLDKIDILKIDIEGAEKEVFRNSHIWLDKVDSVVIELHEQMKPGCNRSFYNGSNGFVYEWIVGENVCLSRGNFIVPN